MILELRMKTVNRGMRQDKSRGARIRAKIWNKNQGTSQDSYRIPELKRGWMVDSRILDNWIHVFRIIDSKIQDNKILDSTIHDNWIPDNRRQDNKNHDNKLQDQNKSKEK